MSIYDFSKSNHFFGNSNLDSMLDNIIKSDRISHAYMFYGMDLLFKTHVALNFAMRIFCSSTENPIPCGECSACKKVLAGSHPDLYLYNQDGTQGGKKGDILIDTVRFIRQDAYIRPNESFYKIYVIPNIQNMGISAVNAFLKILEEPPTHTIFLLTAISKTSVLDTILSRCIPLEVFPITTQEVHNALTTLRPEVSAEQLEGLSTISDGFIGKAINLLESENSNSISNDARKVTIAILNKNEYDLLLIFTQIGKNDVIMTNLLSEMSIYFKNGLKQKLKPSSGDKLIIALAQHFSLEIFYNILEIIEKERRAIKTNVNLNIFSQNLSASLIKAINKQ